MKFNLGNLFVTVGWLWSDIYDFQKPNNKLIKNSIFCLNDHIKILINYGISDFVSIVFADKLEIEDKNCKMFDFYYVEECLWMSKFNFCATSVCALSNIALLLFVCHMQEFLILTFFCSLSRSLSEWYFTLAVFVTGFKIDFRLLKIWALEIF